MPIAPVLGAVIGLAAALAVGLIPADIIEDVMIASGLPAILPAAEPPLGLTARLGMVFVTAGGIGLAAWFLLFLLLGSRTLGVGAADHDEDGRTVPVLRRSDAHPDAPARRPLFATEDLGTPFLEIHAPSAAPIASDAGSFAMPVEEALDVLVPSPPAYPAERALPDDLDTPLADFVPFASNDDVAPEPPLARPAPIIGASALGATERFETFELTPLVRREAEAAPLPMRHAAPIASSDTDATITALLARLEKSVAAREPQATPPESPLVAKPSPRSLDDTLGALRRMATRAS
uniref:hypothetical protein n=1 Tax=Sphingomonas sp. GlSt437 TaxID=3389970 RepID=UPI003A8723CF